MKGDGGETKPKQKTKLKKKKPLKKQTQQQQHTHIHKPNKTTAFLAPPKPDGRWYGTSKTQPQAFVYLALSVIWLCSLLLGNTNLPTKEASDVLESYLGAAFGGAVPKDHRTQEEGTG